MPSSVSVVSLIGIILAAAATILLSPPSLVAAQIDTRDTGEEVCASNFNQQKTVTVVSHVPSGSVDIIHFDDLSKYYLIECIYMRQYGFPVTENYRECSNPPTQRLQLCHAPAEGSTFASAAWNCSDASQFLTKQFNRIYIGSKSGPLLRFKMTWSSGLTEVACFPRYFAATIVSLDVPQPGTEPAVSGTFAGVVGVIAISVVAYGAYAFYRVTKKFEHREGGDGAGGGDAGMISGGGASGPAEQYKAALRALGAPDELTSFYDEGGAGDENDNADDEEGDDEAEEDEEMYDDDGGDGGVPAERGGMMNMSNVSSASAAVVGASPSVIVLDNNQVLTSTPAPVPWFEKEAAAKMNNNRRTQQQQRQQQQRPQSIERSRSRSEAVYYSDEE